MSPEPELAPLALTGERTAPGIRRENYWFARHLACYHWVGEHLASTIPAGRPSTVLDAGAGEGYGSHELAALTGASVLALELDAVTAAHARRAYPDIDVVQANLIAMPLADQSVSASVSFQVIEHLWDVPRYLAELARCTRGPIAISTPNRFLHSPGLGRGEKPTNPFHVREFDAAELAAELRGVTPGDVVVHGLHHGYSIHEWESTNGSLPTALFSEDAGNREAAEDFAASLGPDDFHITNDDVDVAQDLIAWWQPT